jgi:hypothetical protein
MYAFLFVLVPLAIVVAWALAQDRKRRHRRHAPGADMQSRIRAARESAKDRAAKWMLRATQDEQGGLRDAFADAWWNGTSLVPEGGLASQLCQAAGGAGRSVVISRIWIVALGVVALAASCGCGGGPEAEGPAATPPPVTAGSADTVCTPSACISLSRLVHSIDSQLKGNVVGYVRGGRPRRGHRRAPRAAGS